jgi:hypothetical protein
LPILRWAKEQGGVVGFAHSGWGLQSAGKTLPNNEMPKFDGIGANEFIVDVTHNACDFISAVDTPILWEMNIWYHTLNCGMKTRVSGETDFPCIYGERVGLGRAYVQLDPNGRLDYDTWVAGLRDGRSYVCDGLSHLVDFRVGELGVGQRAAPDAPASELKAERNKPLPVTIRAAALLAETPREDIHSKPLDQKPYWHVERARIENTRTVPVELIVNGQAVERRMISADGRLEDLRFEFTPQRSCWIAVRIFPSSHTNPVFVKIDDKPIAIRSSAEWCLTAVDVCWGSKQAKIRDTERPAASQAFEAARETYRRIRDTASE